MYIRQAAIYLRLIIHRSKWHLKIAFWLNLSSMARHTTLDTLQIQIQENTCWSIASRYDSMFYFTPSLKFVTIKYKY
jgi:hypothetical protein